MQTGSLPSHSQFVLICAILTSPTLAQSGEGERLGHSQLRLAFEPAVHDNLDTMTLGLCSSSGARAVPPDNFADRSRLSIPIEGLTLGRDPEGAAETWAPSTKFRPFDAQADGLEFDTTFSLSMFSEASDDQPAPTPEGSTTDAHSLAVKLSNPVANLISVPIQFNWDTGIGQNDADKLVVNIEPVIPIHLNDDWNLITRTILPVVYAEAPAPGFSDEFGLGDTTLSLFFSPTRKVGGWILGAGPILYIPTGTDDLFRLKQFGMGPTGVALRQEKLGDGTLSFGMLASHTWKVAGSDDFPGLNSTFIQPFCTYTLKTGTTFGLNSESTYDWSSYEWNVPINLWVAQLVKFGDQPVQFEFGGRYYAESPSGGPDWGLRFQVTFLFPE